MKVTYSDHPQIGILLSFLLVAYGIKLAISFMKNKKLCNESLTWPSVDGRVTECEALSIDEIRQQLGPMIYIRVKYSVLGKEYVCRQAHVYRPVYDKEEVVELTNKFPVGSIVKVFYNPDEPSKSALIVGARRDAQKYEHLYASGFLVVVGVIFFMLSWSSFVVWLTTN